MDFSACCRWVNSASNINDVVLWPSPGLTYKEVMLSGVYVCVTRKKPTGSFKLQGGSDKSRIFSSYF